MKARVRVDGLNLYYGCLKGTPCRWLDIHRLCTLLLPRHQIARVKYFTARVMPMPSNPDAPTRQDT
jgi:hypothetical protein